jgi:hypothetical protein
MIPDHTIRLACCWVASAAYFVGSLAWEAWPAVPTTLILLAFFTHQLESEVRYLHELSKQVDDEPLPN